MCTNTSHWSKFKARAPISENLKNMVDINSAHGSNQAYHLLQRTPSWPETPPPYPQYGAAFQLVQQDGSRRGSTQAYHMLRVAQNAQLKMPNGALANQPSAGNNAGC